MPRLPPELTSGLKHDGSDPLTILRQVSNLAEIDDLGCGEWTVLYEYRENNASESRYFYSALISPRQARSALRKATWEISSGCGYPGFVQRFSGKRRMTTYDRFGGIEAEPLIFRRDFHGIKPEQFDLSEEFRLFHNLYHDRPNDRYIHIDAIGRESVAVEIDSGRVRVLTRLLRQYMAARQLALALYFDHRVYSNLNKFDTESGLSSISTRRGDRYYRFSVGEMHGHAFSRLLGKKIIPPPPISECGAWPYASDPKGYYGDFIIGVDEQGKSITHSCDPDRLANYFGANESAPNYLTPVWFTRDVLTKYYDQPSKYSVEDGYLRCGSLWGLRIDNNLSDHVVVYLGDLGRDLHHDEQRHWANFNVTPGDRRPSETNFARSFAAECADPSEPDLLFKQNFIQTNRAWEKKFGWPLFRIPHKDDAHIFKQLRVPITDEISEFDSQVLLLVKLVVDALNESEMEMASGGSMLNEKGISKFERFLRTKMYPHISRDIKLLRDLQGLRSSGSAHLKGKAFARIRSSVGLNSETPPKVFRRLLTAVNEMLGGLTTHFGLSDD